MKYKSIFKEEKIMPFDWDNGGDRVQLLDVVQFDNKVLLFQQTYSIACQLEKKFNQDQRN